MASKPKAVKAAPAAVPSTPPAVPDVVHKLAVCDEIKAVSDEQRTIQFRVSTDVEDRQRDIVEARGWRLDEFRRNPVVLFGHDYHSLPVARAVSLNADEHGLSMVAQFPTKEVYPFADTVYQMVKGGFLNATSVGFKPLKWVYEEDRGGVRYSEQNLLEVSVCPVPANPQALVEARAIGIEVDDLRAWAEAVLKMDAGEPAKATPGEAPAPAPVAPAIAPAPDVTVKAGRVLSGRNESAIRDSLAAMAAAMEQLNAVLAQLASDEPASEGDGKAAEPVVVKAEEAPSVAVAAVVPETAITIADEPVVFRLVEDPEPRIVVDPAMIGEVIAQGTIDCLAAVVDARVGSALSALRGRLD